MIPSHLILLRQTARSSLNPLLIHLTRRGVNNSSGSDLVLHLVLQPLSIKCKLLRVIGLAQSYWDVDVVVHLAVFEEWFATFEEVNAVLTVLQLSIVEVRGVGRYVHPHLPHRRILIAISAVVANQLQILHQIINPYPLLLFIKRILISLGYALVLILILVPGIAYIISLIVLLLRAIQLLLNLDLFHIC